MPKDDGGKLGRVKITVVGKDDKEKKVIKEMSGDDMLDYLDKHDGKIEFEVPKEVLSAKDGDSRLMVECADCSVDEGGKTNEVKKYMVRIQKQIQRLPKMMYLWNQIRQMSNQ